MFHRWVSTDFETHDACLVCGGMWVNTEPDSVVLHFDTMQSFDGSPAVDCTGNPSQCHHYAGECPVDECHLDPACNCLYCYS
jgi:hypothetical protein